MTKLINIALQGGGAHGAFVWGVLDKFLEDGRMQIEDSTVDLYREFLQADDRPDQGNKLRKK